MKYYRGLVYFRARELIDKNENVKAVFRAEFGAVASEPVEKWDGSTASASPPLSSLPLSSSFPPPSSPLPSPSLPLPLEVGPLKSS